MTVAAATSAESLAQFAGLLAERTRAAMCLALLDGTAWAAGELGRLPRERGPSGPKGAGR